MTVVGQPTVSYGWDNANRLTGITQGSASIPFGYDNADRRNTLTLPNGILLTYTYDNDSHVTAMTWTLASNPVGDLEYSYDADGRVIEKTGSFAQTGLPQAVTGNAFNAANEMTAFNGTPQTYDGNGNLSNDGTNTYAWDARNHLVGISGANTASFVYDADGRRAQKMIGSTSTQFLYDGLNLVQELQNGAPSANMLPGLGIDEYFQRTDTSGTYDYLSDILGSTLALTDSSRIQQTSYTYDPFGNSTLTGASSSNPYQFTGRENDGTGLYNFRARYYSPTQQRFNTQDPLDLYGGDWNLYAYVGNDPASETDPLGTITYSRGGRFRACNKQESEDCESTCKADGKTVQSCVVRQIFRVSGGKGDDGGRFFPIRKWIDGPPSCSCNEPPSGEKCSILGAAAGVSALGALSQLLQGFGGAPGLGIPEPVLP